MNRFLLLALLLLIASGCSSKPAKKKVAQKNETDTSAKESDASENKTKFKSPRQGGSLGLDPTKGINAKPVEKGNSDSPTQPKGNKPQEQETPQSQTTPKPPTEFDYLFETRPKKSSQEVTGKVSSKKKVSIGEEEERSSGDRYDPLSVNELHARMAEEPGSLEGKLIHVTGEVFKSGIGRFGNENLPTMTLCDELDYRETIQIAPNAKPLTCIMGNVSDLLRVEPGGGATLRGMLDEKSKTFKQCKVTSSYGGMIERLSAEDFAGLFKREPQFLKQHFQKKQILLRGTVKLAATENTPLYLEGAEGVSIGIVTSQSNEEGQFKDVKPNQEVVVIGRVSIESNAAADSSPLNLHDTTRIDIVSKSALTPPTSPWRPTFSEDKKAVLAFSIDFDKLLNSESVKTIGWPKIVRLAELDMFFDINFLPDLKRISGFVGNPKGGLNQNTHQNTDLFVRLETKSDAYAKSMEEEMSFAGFQVVVRNGKRYWFSARENTPPWFVWREGNVLLASTESYLLAGDSSQLPSSNLAVMLQKQKTSPFFIAGDLGAANTFISQFCEMAKSEFPPEMGAKVELLKRISKLVISTDQDGNLIAIEITGTNDAASSEIEMAFQELVSFINQSVTPMIGLIKQDLPSISSLGTALVKGLKLEKQGATVVLSLAKPANFDQLLVDATKSAQMQFRKQEDLNLMRQATLSLWNYSDVFRKLPFAMSDNVKLSWRVRVLPFFEQNALFDRFNIEKNWDDETNVKWSKPEFNPFKLSSGATISFVEPKTIPENFQQVADPGDQSIVFIEDRRTDGDPWTKPSNITPEQVYEMVSKLEDGDQLIVGFYDGRVKRISNKITKETIMRLCDPTDGKEILESDIK